MLCRILCSHAGQGFDFGSVRLFQNDSNGLSKIHKRSKFTPSGCKFTPSGCKFTPFCTRRYKGYLQQNSKYWGSFSGPLIIGGIQGVQRVSIYTFPNPVATKGISNRIQKYIDILRVSIYTFLHPVATKGMSAFHILLEIPLIAVGCKRV